MTFFGIKLFCAHMPDEICAGCLLRLEAIEKGILKERARAQKKKVKK